MISTHRTANRLPTPPAWMMMRAATEILFSRRVTLTEHYWVTFRERRSSAEGTPKPNQFWWPDTLDLSPLRQHAIESNPLGKDFNYVKEFESLDLQAVEKDIADVLKTSQDWWPSDYGNFSARCSLLSPMTRRTRRSESPTTPNMVFTRPSLGPMKSALAKWLRRFGLGAL